MNVATPVSQSTTASSLWASIREALRGSHQDFTQGSLNRAILLLAIPMVLEMVLESLFAVVDVFWVSRLGADAVATVGLTESMLSLVFAVGLGLSMSTTAMVARRIGEKDHEGASVAAVQAIWIGLAISVAIGLPCYLLASHLLHAMGASREIVLGGSGYTRIALGGSGVLVMLFLNNAIFRGAGDAAIAMRLLWVSNIINLVLDPCLIFGLGPFPKLGVTGAALSTFSGRGIGVLTTLGDISAEKVVLCAGMWTRQLALKCGANVPVYPVEHPYLVSNLVEGASSALPCVRDPDAQHGLKLQG